MSITTTTQCPTWCTEEHRPGGSFHASPTYQVQSLEGPVDVRVSFDPASDPEYLLEVIKDFPILFNQRQARQLARTLLQLTEAAGR
ncbi:hypothetical protein [Microlunatus sp. Y2014]|uniref:hypothetical protein n=1 Tax=Microlunatus sp. Y2014 TaxID=3418488 RepID=UPI003DA73986